MNQIMKLFRAWKQSNLMLRILTGIILGSILGITMPGYSVISMLGDLFVGALKGIAPILVGVLVTASVAKAHNGLGSRFKTVVMLYMFTTLMAAVLAVFASSLFPISIVLANVVDTSMLLQVHWVMYSVTL